MWSISAATAIGCASTPTSGMRSNRRLTNNLHHGKPGERRLRHTEAGYLISVQFSPATNEQFPSGVDTADQIADPVAICRGQGRPLLFFGAPGRSGREPTC